METAQVIDPTPGATTTDPPPVETPEEKTPEQLEAEKKAADEAKQETEDAEEETRVRKKPWFQKRIDEITKQRHESERRAERLERMVEQLVQRGQPPTEQKPAEPPVSPSTARPTREQFDFDEDKYIDAVADWKYEQRQMAAEHQHRQKEQQTTQEKFQQDFGQKVADIRKTGAEKFPDFVSVVESVPANVFDFATALAISETAMPADITYHLAKHPDEAERIAKLPPLKKAIELGKLEASISANAAKKTTAAPPPPNPVGGKEPASTDPDKLPIDEWMKLRNAGKI